MVLLVHKPNAYETLREFYQSLDLVIGTRMHSLIIACANSLPVIGLSWQSKIDDMFKLIGSEERCFPLTDVEDPKKFWIYVSQSLRNMMTSKKESLNFIIRKISLHLYKIIIRRGILRD